MKFKRPDDLMRAQGENQIPPGNTIDRIRKMVKKDGVNMKKLVTLAPEITPTLEKTSREQLLKIEGVALSAIFIGEVWQDIQSWIKNHPSELVEPFDSSEGVLIITIPKEKVKSKLTNVSSQDATKIINDYTSNIFLSAVEHWRISKEDKLRREEALGQGGGAASAFGRYKKVLDYDLTNITMPSKRKIGPREHIVAGLNTARYITWQLFGILDEVYKNQYGGRLPTKIELEKLVEGTKPLINVIASADVETLSALQENLTTTSPFFDHTQFDRDFDPKNFYISVKNGSMYLEIKDSMLDIIEAYRQSLGNEFLHTGCPAAASKGTGTKNVVAELADWFAKLYKELYIDSQDRFK